jgi:hypothetical protein
VSVEADKLDPPRSFSFIEEDIVTLIKRIKGSLSEHKHAELNINRNRPIQEEK